MLNYVIVEYEEGWRVDNRDGKVVFLKKADGWTAGAVYQLQDLVKRLR